jgi:hypothetical protein
VLDGGHQLRRGRETESGRKVDMPGMEKRCWQHERVLLVVVALLETVGVGLEQRVLEKHALLGMEQVRLVRLGTEQVRLVRLGMEQESCVRLG